MFSGQVGREDEFDPLTVRYGSLTRNIYQRHLINLELLLDKALASAPCSAEEQRMAFAISEVLFNACFSPSIGLVHRTLGLLWENYSTSDYMRRVIDLFQHLVCYKFIFFFYSY